MLAIIIVNWNGRQHLEACFNSLFRQTFKGFKVIFVDNGSTDDSVDYIKSNFPQVKIIQNDKNYGFAEGNNIGIREAMKDPEIKYIVTLNNDTEQDECWLEELVRVAEQDDRVGACASKLLYYNNRKKIDSAGDFYYLGSIKVVPRGHGQDDVFFQQEECLTPCAAATLYRRKTLEQVRLGKDYFDSDYFAYIEDSDLGLRIRLAGWTCIFVPKAIVFHKVSATTSKWKADQKKYYSVRNRIFTAIKLYPVGLWLRALRNPITYQGASGFANSMSLSFRILYSVLKKLPTMLKKRTIIKHKNTINKIIFNEWQSKFTIR